MTGLVFPNGRPIVARDVARAKATAFGRSHEAADSRGTFLSQWRPGLRSANADWLYDRDQVVARARDIARNDGVAGSAVNRRINSAVGYGWRRSCKPDHRALGISYAAAKELGRQMESAWKAFSQGVQRQADAERQLTFGQLLRMSAAHVFQDGEALGLVEWASDEPTLFKTRLRIVDPDRLSNPNGRPDSPTLAGGIETNAAGVRQRYWIREGHPGDLAGVANLVWRPWEVYATTLGRPQVLHAYDKLRAGQSRGVTRFVTVLKNFRALSRYTDATIEAATINALFLAFVKSNAGPSAVSDAFSADDLGEFAGEREDHYRDNPIDLGGVTMPVLGLDDEVQMQTAARDTSGFDAFTRAILRLIAAALGLTYEELTMDFSQTNYSSARAALLIAWTETLALRGLLEAQIAQPFFVAWLEEAFDIGVLKAPPGAPSFYDAMDAYADGRWVGPGRGTIDPVKEIDAAAAKVEQGMSTLEDMCAELDGSDWEVTAEELAHEIAEYERLGLRHPHLAGTAPKSPPASEAERAREADARPGASARIRALARSAAHDQALDARPA